MKKIKDMWNKNRVLFVLAAIVIICFIIMLVVCVKYFVGNGNSNYGDRLDSISDIPLKDEDKNAIIAKFQENETVTNVEVRTQGKIIYIRATFENVTMEKAKEIANGTLSVIPEEYLTNYDIHYTLISEGTENQEGFIVMGAKNIGESQLQIIWNNNTPITTEE